MSVEKWTASWPQGWKASSSTSRSDSCTPGVASEGRAIRVFHARPRDFRRFTLTAYRFYLMVRSFERRDRDASTRVPLAPGGGESTARSEEHTSELQSQSNLVCRLLLEKKKK